MDYVHKQLADIKLILLFILKHSKMPLLNTQISDLILQYELMDYFVLQQNLYTLAEEGYVRIHNDLIRQYYSLTDKGSEAIDYFEKRISYTNREKLLASIHELKEEIRRSTEVVCTFAPGNEGEYNVECNVMEKDNPLMKISFSVISKDHAKKICKNWRDNYVDIYPRILAAMMPEISAKKLAEKMTEETEESNIL